MTLALLPQAPVWVLDDPRAPAKGLASAIAGRLGLPFRRLHGLQAESPAPGGPGPGLVLSCGAAAGMRALLLRARHGCRGVHCATGSLAYEQPYGWLPFDLTVWPSFRGEPAGWAERSTTRPWHKVRRERMLPVLGVPTVVSPALLARARDLWDERLSHLPHPRVALLFGGGERKAALALGRQLTAIVGRRRGSVMVSVLPDGARVGESLLAGLAGCLHLVYRAGEPGEDPTLGFLGVADAVVVAGVGVQTLSEACAASAPIFAAATGGEDRQARMLLDRLRQARQVRPLTGDLSAWPREPLDEAGRIAREIRLRFGGVER